MELTLHGTLGTHLGSTCPVCSTSVQRHGSYNRVCTTSYIPIFPIQEEKIPIFLYRKAKKHKTSYIWPSLDLTFLKYINDLKYAKKINRINSFQPERFKFSRYIQKSGSHSCPSHCISYVQRHKKVFMKDHKKINSYILLKNP